MDGLVVSVTTDGFITNIDDLEYKIVRGVNCVNTLLKQYAEIRKQLSGDETSLELKTSGKGIIS